MMCRAATISTRRFVACAVVLFVCAPAAAESFMAGADISSLPVHEGRGAVYRANNVAGDAIDILSDSGTNYFRLRLFVNPQGKNNFNGGNDPFVAQSLSYTIALAQRVKAAGGKLLLDFHYSDTWADPGHQWKPAAWRSMTTLGELQQQVYDYTRQSIEAFKSANVMPDMVQIGNEIASGMLWNNEYVSNVTDATVGGANTGYPWTGGANDPGFDRLASLLSAGIRGTRDAADPGDQPLIMIHHDQGTRWDRTSYFFNKLLPRLQTNGTDIDVIGYSYHPTFHPGGIAAVAQNLNNTVAAYGKKVLIAETGFPARNPQSDEQNLGFPVTQDGQRQFLQALVDTVQNVPNDMGMGVFWWYAEARPTTGLNVYEGGRYGLFDQNGNLQPAAGVFSEFLPTPGDFNRDGFVDTADYTVWRNGFNTGEYDKDDYTDWKTNFGAAPDSGGGLVDSVSAKSIVPESTGTALIAILLFISFASKRNRC